MTLSIAALVELARAVQVDPWSSKSADTMALCDELLAIFGTSADPCGYEASDVAVIVDEYIDVDRNRFTLDEARFALRTLADAIQQLSEKEGA